MDKNSVNGGHIATTTKWVSENLMGHSPCYHGLWPMLFFQWNEISKLVQALWHAAKGPSDKGPMVWLTDKELPTKALWYADKRKQILKIQKLFLSFCRPHRRTSLKLKYHPHGKFFFHSWSAMKLQLYNCSLNFLWDNFVLLLVLLNFIKSYVYFIKSY